MLRDDAIRLLALRVRTESRVRGCTGIDHRLLHIPMGHEREHEQGDPELIFFALRDGEVYEVGVHLTPDLREALEQADSATWQGVLEFVEDDLLHRH